MSAAEAQTLAVRSTQYRDYPEELKAAVISAIEANGGQIRPTAKLFNLPYDTVHYWWAHSERFRQIQPASAQNLADKLENLANDTADSLLQHDFSIVAARDKAAVMAVAIDKMQLLRGQPTEIVERVDSTKVLLLLADALAPAIDVTPCASGEDQAQEAISEVPQNQGDTNP